MSNVKGVKKNATEFLGVSTEELFDTAQACGRMEERARIICWLASNEDIIPGDIVHALVKVKAHRMNW